MTSRLLGAAAFTVMTLGACGGRLTSGADGGSDGGLDTDAGAHWTPCSSPSGYQLCGSSANCNPDCQLCIPVETSIGICGDQSGPDPARAFATSSGCMCEDGAVCVLATSKGDAGTPFLGSCYVWEVGELLRRAGAGDHVLYADTSAFDGTALPVPTDCPTLAGLTLCGGVCGDTCAHDGQHFCVGRSPKHPFSLCGTISPSIPQNVRCTRTNPPSDGKHGCLIFKDLPADQPFADINGIFMDLTPCQAAAANYPGGADCVAQ